MKREHIVEVLDFFNSIEGAGYGGMASFEIAREHMRRAYRISLGDAVREERALNRENIAQIIMEHTCAGYADDKVLGTLQAADAILAGLTAERTAEKRV